jgi:hypothetical protein
MRRRLVEIDRFVKPDVLAFEHLIGADDNDARPAS